MKYANGYLITKGKQVKAFICAKTYKRMIEIAGYHLRRYDLDTYWSKCGNDEMKETAQDKEGIWVNPDGYGKGKYKKVNF